MLGRKSAALLGDGPAHHQHFRVVGVDEGDREHRPDMDAVIQRGAGYLVTVIGGCKTWAKSSLAWPASLPEAPSGCEA